MNRRQFLILSISSTLLGCHHSSGHALPKGAKISALGDSLTEGYGTTIQNAYPAVLAQLTGWNVRNDGISGNTSKDVLMRLEGIIQAQPQLVLLGIGGNDFLRQIPNTETINNINQIITQFKNASIPVVLIAEPYLSATGLITGHLSDHPLYKQIAQEQHIPLFADAWSDILSDKSLKSDPIHANEKGYRLFAEKLLKYLKKQGFLA